MVDCYMALHKMRNAVNAATNCCKQMKNHPKALTVSVFLSLNNQMSKLLYLFFNIALRLYLDHLHTELLSINKSIACFNSSIIHICIKKSFSFHTRAL